MNNIELNHLKYFYYTVLEGGVAQAAHRLCVQQPVVSKMLKLLDEELGEALFWKKGRSKCLTDYGQLVFRHCQVIFDEVHKIKEVALNPQEMTGLLSVGGAEPIVNFLLEPVFSQLMGSFPRLNFNVYTSTQNHLLKMISEGQLEVGCFFYVPNMPKDLEVITSISLPFRLVVKRSMANNKDVIESFIGSREVDDTSTHHFPTVEFVRKKYPRTEIAFSSNSITLHKQLVMAGKGIAILPQFMVQKELKRESLVDLFPRKTFSWDLMIVKRKSSHLSIPAQTFSDLLTKTIKTNS